ncbi:MAG TPA: hypothetical protein VF212_04325 [Longimicrobiales bacterium]
MPIGSFINVFPPAVFMVIHLALLLVGVYLAVKAAGAYGGDVAAPFWLYALAELFYLTYHMDWTVILFAHTVAEVLDAVAVLLLFAAVGRRVVKAGQAGAKVSAGAL